MSEMLPRDYNNPEQHRPPEHSLLGPAATGTIQPNPERQPDHYEVLCRLAEGEFHTHSDGPLPVQCIDGRSGDGIQPDTAGGSALTAMVADDLIRNRYQDGSHNLGTALIKALDDLRARNLPVGGHTDDHAHGELSGCGANDRLPEVYEKLTTQADTIRHMLRSLGVEVSDATHDKILANAQEKHSFLSGRQALNTLSQAPGAKVATLRGGHNEVAVIINQRPDTTLDRRALYEAYGDDYQAFNVDVWAIDNLTKRLATNLAEAHDLFVAALYYNLATGLTLCGPDMPVVALRPTGG